MSTLPGVAKTVVKDAAVVGATVAVVLGSLAAILPDLHVPASDTAIVTAVAAGVAAFVSWAKSHGFVAKVTGR